MRGYLEDLPLSGIGASHVDVLEEVHWMQPGASHVPPIRKPHAAEASIETEGPAGAHDEGVVSVSSCYGPEEVLQTVVSTTEFYKVKKGTH